MDTYVEKAFESAHEALKAGEVPVGCVFVVNGEIVAQSRNTVNETRNPTRHAEINCIDIVINSCSLRNIDFKAFFKKVEVYVTVEPCIMCAAALHDLKVMKIVYGCDNDRFGGKTVVDISKFYEQTYILIGKVRADDAMVLLKDFYSGTNPMAPEEKIKKRKN